MSPLTYPHPCLTLIPSSYLPLCPFAIFFRSQPTAPHTYDRQPSDAATSVASSLSSDCQDVFWDCEPYTDADTANMHASGVLLTDREQNDREGRGEINGWVRAL